MDKPIDKSDLKKILLDHDKHTMKFTEIHNIIRLKLGGTVYNGQGPNFSKWITRNVQRIVEEEGCGRLFCGPSGKRYIGVVVDFKQGKQEPQQQMAPLPPPKSEWLSPEQVKDRLQQSTPEPEQPAPEFDLLIVGKSIDRYIQELKEQLNDLKYQFQETKMKNNYRIKELLQDVSDRDRTIEKLNQRITNLNNLVKSDSNKNHPTSFKFAELAKFR